MKCAAVQVIYRGDASSEARKAAGPLSTGSERSSLWRLPLAGAELERNLLFMWPPMLHVASTFKSQATGHILALSWPQDDVESRPSGGSGSFAKVGMFWKDVF